MLRFAAALLALSFLPACRAERPQEQWTDSAPAPELRGVGIRREGPLSVRDLHGRVVLLAFGYTSCTEICPLTLTKFHDVLRELKGDASRVAPLYTSVDPERDSPDHFRAFLKEFDPRIEGLFIDRAALNSALAGYQVVAQKQPPPVRRYVSKDAVDPNADYAIDHTSTIFVIDAAGRLRIRYSFKAPPETIAAGVRKLLAESAG